MIDVFFCHRHEFLTYAHDLGYRLGTRADQMETNRIHKTVDKGYSIDFVDNDFKNPNFDELFDAVKLLSPEYAVLPDVMGDITLDDVLEWGSQLEDYGTNPIVVPKGDCEVKDIPMDWVVGYSVPSGYGSTEIPIEDCAGHQVHLLGGSHRNQIKIADEAQEYGVEVISVDGNAFAKGASYGNLVNDPEIILSGGNAWEIDVDEPEDWSDRVRESLHRYIDLWELWSEKHDVGPETAVAD